MNPNRGTAAFIYLYIDIRPAGEGITLDQRLISVVMSSYNHHHRSVGRMGRGGAYSGGGRGEYFKQKYSGGRGRRGDQGGDAAPPKQGEPMSTRCTNVII